MTDDVNLAVLVAHDVLGWRLGDHGCWENRRTRREFYGVGFAGPGYEQFDVPVWDPCNRIEQALLVLEKLREDWLTVSLVWTDDTDLDFEAWVCSLGWPVRYASASDKPGRAICEVAMEWQRIKKRRKGNAV